MVRPPLSSWDRERGRRLGQLLRAARGNRSMVEIAARCGVSVDTLRKIETGRIPTPALFTVAAVAATLELSLDDLVAACPDEKRDKPGVLLVESTPLRRENPLKVGLPGQ